MSKIPFVRKPVKYLTNKELLAEINRCKKSYCSFVDEAYGDFDGIVNSLDEVTDDFLEHLCAKRSKDLSKKGEEPVVVVPHGLVIRLMTYDHIPLDPDRKRKSRAANQTHAMTTFPPFKHFVIEVDEDGERTFREVGRSHWEGGLENGWFSPDKGKVSERMGMMYSMLVERYSRRGNWRGYCYDSETEVLTQRGWLRNEDINLNDIVLSHNMDSGNLVWSKISDIYRNHYAGDMFRLSVTGLDALVTPGHKFITREDGLKPVELLKETDRIVLMGDAVEAEESTETTHDDAFVELVGWVVTEGSFYFRKESRLPRLTVYQNEGAYADRIRDCLRRLGTQHSEYKRVRKVNEAIAFNLRSDITGQILEVVDGVERGKKILSPDFIVSLSPSQRELLINTMIDGDGWRSRQNKTLKVGYTQKCKEHMDSFAMLCTISGKQISVKEGLVEQKSGKVTPCYQATIWSPRFKHCRVENVDMHGAKRSGKRKGVGKHSHPNKPTVPYNGVVWCVSTDYGTLVVRRGDYIYTCSNSYLDEMKSLALVQLCQVGLQFDESKSSNPFAFYTTTITNCFTRVFNLEKKNQNIRDDLLISMGAAPSYTRQIETELAQSGSIEPTVIPSRRGRKTAAQVSAEKEAQKPIRE